MNPDELSGVLQELAEDVSPEAARVLAEAYGGQRLYIPYSLAADHRLVMLLGRDAAEWLHQRYAGLYLQVPSGASARLAERNRALRRAAERGMSRSELARRWQLSRRQVIRILQDEA